MLKQVILYCLFFLKILPNKVLVNSKAFNKYNDIYKNISNSQGARESN